MAEVTNQPAAPLPTAEEVAAHNAEVIAKVKGQEGTPKPDPVEQKSTGDALDALLKQAEDKSKGAPPVEKKDDPTPPVEPKLDEAAKAAAAEAAKKEEEAKAAQEADLKKADDYFKDQPSLPQGASVKSHEAFSSIKIKAAQEISKKDAELEAARKELATLKEASGKPSPELEKLRKENEEHAKWRAKMDVDFDPKFKEFDKDAEVGREFIYSQLRKSGIIAEPTIDKIKKLGGPDKVAMKPIFDALNDSTTQRLVEAKLADIEMSKYKKEQAIAQTKDNIVQYQTEREAAAAKASTESVESTKRELDQMWTTLEWTKNQTAKQGATEAEKTAVDNHNKFVADMRKELDAAIADNSPKMKATMLTAVAQLFNLQEVHKAAKAQLETLTKENTELKAFKDKVKAAGRSRLPESQAPTSGAASVQKPVNQFNTSAADGLDALAKQVMAERAAKGQ
jgi:hypothetical protein